MSGTARYLGTMQSVEDNAEIDRAGGGVLEATRGWGGVHGFVPEVFERYARVFHPAMRKTNATCR